MSEASHVGRRLFALWLAGLAVVFGLLQSRDALSENVIQSGVPSSISLRQVAYVDFKSDKTRGASITSVAWSPDGRRLAASSDWGSQITVFDTTTWKEVSRFGGRSFQTTRSLVFISDREIVTPPNDNDPPGTVVLAVYDSESGHLLRQMPRPHGFEKALTTSIAVTSDRKYLAAIVNDGRLSTLLFEADSGRFLNRLSTPVDSSTPVLAGGSGSKLAVSVSLVLKNAEPNDRQQIYTFNAATNMVDQILAGHVPYVGSIAWSPDGHLIASGAPMLQGPAFGKWVRDPDPIRIWDAATGAKVTSFVGEYDPVSHLAWLPSSKVLVTLSARGGDRRGSAIRLWSIPRNEMLFEHLPADEGVITTLSVDPASNRLAWCLEGILQIFEVVGAP